MKATIASLLPELRHLVFFLETSTCLEYALRVDERIQSPYNKAVTDFIGCLVQKNIRIVSSATVKAESERQLVTAVNCLVDRASWRRARLASGLIRAKVQERLQRLWSRTDIKTLNPNTKLVLGFCLGLTRNLSTRLRLEKVRRLKKRIRLLPEDSDIRILSEAFVLSQGDDALFFVTKDEDFCEFRKEVEIRFRIRVLPVQELIQFRLRLEPFSAL